MTLEELKKLEAGATPEWRVTFYKGGMFIPLANKDADESLIIATRTMLPKLIAVVEAAKEVLQTELDEYGHGRVESWSTELEVELGWGENCAPIKLGRALSDLEKE